MTAPASVPAADVAWLDIRVGELRQIFNAMDPAPFRERDIDPNAENYIVEWGRETRGGQSLGVVVHLGREAANAATAGMLRDALREYFRQRADAARRRLRLLFRDGRESLWWPIRDEARLLDRLGAMQLGLVDAEGTAVAAAA
jgi:hypothetical protein